ncbi:tRNA pseudouridine(38-40) synthase TruA [Thermomonas sp.]|jgi:tRNA pseudouridine38-40 synthase|uniref:tRNA pseudouridine(38-40) synthase TruA n=1 Tax=Thermomonas sp. TaxID=1971895 RepID=UPI001B5709FA|nr:tRNA pseudouridine(38-40) synthase TruA [Thermomonas sp.]MBK6332252.1 tRNA pseudouridine(38-40) synthase TruA [Thermomonas sp.]MBK6417134.1 tRNA pseudouridine(38-40) synthase TruA [Thermomonas sp.]MBK7204584.1 tRNA pseudouridine(38-40) synthase TruA [Thermomonas sp.]MBK9668488.1 tRNA pseudouridine(38-40) synthase TruA [Thermomonas sp.]MBL0227012.1 tRNA pseudouridine(38-40) synthase TruA [Thermomonas sp.]
MRLALGVEYDGSGFSGWQRLSAAGSREPDGSLQTALEAALSRVADARIDTICAGRTDAGVHGQCQVVHFDSDVVRDARGWVLGTTANLPPTMAVRWCVPVAGDFSARFSARARRYRYRILNRSTRPGLQRQYLGWERMPLDAQAMHAAAQALVGERDFSAFRSVQCQATHARRDLQEISVHRRGAEVVVEVQANAFLHHMVRNIVGSLLVVGRGERPPAWIAELLERRDRTVAGPTAPAAGLLFLGPRYPRGCGLPDEVSL